MTDRDIINDCVKYCIIKARGHRQDEALKKISKALYHCDGSKQSINECMILLKVLYNEG